MKPNLNLMFNDKIGKIIQLKNTKNNISQLGLIYQMMNPVIRQG